MTDFVYVVRRHEGDDVDVTDDKGLADDIAAFCDGYVVEEPVLRRPARCEWCDAELLHLGGGDFGHRCTNPPIERVVGGQIVLERRPS